MIILYMIHLPIIGNEVQVIKIYYLQVF